MNQVESRGTGRVRVWLAALSTAGFLLAAPDARAGDEFEDGFKDELGRLAAHEAVGIGRGVLASILLGGHRGYYDDYPAYPTHRPRYYDDDDYYPRHRHYPRWHYGGRPYYRNHHRHHGYGWGHHPRRHYHEHHHYHHRGCDH